MNFYLTAFLHSLALDKLEICQQGLIGVNASGKIVIVERCPVNVSADDFLATALEKHKIDPVNVKVHRSTQHQFLVPGFIDTHTHAPQYLNAGLGLDLPLLDWLERYTFPHEQTFQDCSVAEKVYPAAVRRHLLFGSTTCCYYGTIHLESTKQLVDIAQMLGQRAFVGKVNMDRNSPAGLTENAAQSVQDTRAFIEYVLSKNSPLLTPVVTPRFAPSCTPELLTELGKLAREYGVPIQSHLSENKGEIAWVKELFPHAKDYSTVYDNFGLLNHKTIMAHCIYLSPEEELLLRERGVGISHCPHSNFDISSGVCPVRRLLKLGLKVGLGTDVSGGHSPSMIEATRGAILASKLYAAAHSEYPPLSVAEGFFLATMGSAGICGLQDLVGNFQIGKQFDAVLVDMPQLADMTKESLTTRELYKHALTHHKDYSDNNIDLWSHDTLMSAFERFIYLGDDRNVKKVWVNGFLVKGA